MNDVTPTVQPRTMRLETISVARAKELIENQPPRYQRRSDMKAIRLYARRMERGQWIDDLPDNVMIFSDAGELMQGMHRCKAAILANRSFGAWTSYGHEPEIIKHLDVVNPRRLNQTLQMTGTDDAVLMSAAAKLFFNYLCGESPFAPITMSIEDVEEVNREFPLLSDWVKEGRRMYHARSFNSAAPTGALLVYLYGRTCMMRAGVATRFWHQLETGADTCDTTLLLRNMWLGFKGKRGNLEGKVWHHNTCVRAWERFCSGTTGKTIVVPRDRLLEWR